MDLYILIGKELIEKERIGIDWYIFWNKWKWNERWNINYGLIKLSFFGDLFKNKKEEFYVNIME